MNNTNKYIVSAGGMFTDVIAVVETKTEVEATFLTSITQLNIISNYLKKNNVKNIDKIPKKDKKVLFTNGLSQTIYETSRFPIQFSFKVSKWNGNYYVDVTKKFHKVISVLPKVKEYRYVKTIKP